MTPQNLLLCRNFAQKMINERDLSSAPQFIAADSVHHEFGDVPSEFQRGPRAMAQFLNLYLRAFPDLRLTFEDALADRDRVVTRWRLEGTHNGPLMGIAPSGRRIGIEGIRIDRVENGKIAESWMQMDTMGLLEQIGALPQVAPRAAARDAARDLGAAGNPFRGLSAPRYAHMDIKTVRP